MKIHTAPLGAHWHLARSCECYLYMQEVSMKNRTIEDLRRQIEDLKVAAWALDNRIRQSLIPLFIELLDPRLGPPQKILKPPF